MFREEFGDLGSVQVIDLDAHGKLSAHRRKRCLRWEDVGWRLMKFGSAGAGYVTVEEASVALVVVSFAA
jgi:hypothetical protein